MREQWLAAGAALGNFLNAAHQLGFGAIVLSGERCFDPALHSALGLREGEHLAGFISLGSITSQPSPRATVAPSPRVRIVVASIDPVSYTHLTLPTKRIV